MPAFSDRTVIENAILAQCGFSPTASILASNDPPHFFWVSTSTGSDGAGSGRFTQPFATIKRAVREAVDGRGDVVLVAAGSYAETLDIGSGDTSFGQTSTNGYAKRNLKIIGVGGGHNGLVQIIGDGTTAQSTIRVQDAYLRGFMLKGIELDTNGLSQAALELITSDTGSAGATANSYRFTIEDVAVRSNDPDVGMLFVGATLGRLKNLYINGPTIGLGFTGSPNNSPDSLEFQNVTFVNGGFTSTPTANIASVASNGSHAQRIAIGGVALSAVTMDHVNFLDATATNFLNLTGSTTTDCGIVNARFCKAPTNGTNGIATLPTNMVVLGHGTSGLVSLKG